MVQRPRVAKAVWWKCAQAFQLRSRKAASRKSSRGEVTEPKRTCRGNIFTPSHKPPGASWRRHRLPKIQLPEQALARHGASSEIHRQVGGQIKTPPGDEFTDASGLCNDSGGALVERHTESTDVEAQVRELEARVWSVSRWEGHFQMRRAAAQRRADGDAEAPGHLGSRALRDVTGREKLPRESQAQWCEGDTDWVTLQVLDCEGTAVSQEAASRVWAVPSSWRKAFQPSWPTSAAPVQNYDQPPIHLHRRGLRGSAICEATRRVQ